MARFVDPDPELDLDQLMELQCGPHPPVGVPDGEPVSVWSSDAERRAAWECHKDRDPLATQRERERALGKRLWAEEAYGS